MEVPSPLARTCDLLTRPVHRFEFLAWCTLAVALVLVRLLAFGIHLDPDSYQYLSVASNFAKGRPGYTSIIHFDTERSHGTVPAPMTTFPSGYPAAIAALSATGLPPRTSGAAISALAFLSLMLLYRAAAAPLGITGLGSRLLFLFTFANSELLGASGTVLSEPCFTLISFGAVLLFAAGVSPRTRPARQWPLLLAANALIGLAYWVRYAGLFLFAAIAAYVAFLLLRRHQAAIRAGWSLSVSASLIALGFIRNQVLVGTWRGGNDMPVNHPILGILHAFPTEIYHLISGRIGTAHYGLLDVLLPLAIATVLLTCMVILLRQRGPAADGATSLLQAGSGYCLVYCAAVMYASHVSMISFTSRMFTPLVPVVLVLFAIVVSRVQLRMGAHRTFLVTTLAILSLAYVATNVRSMMSQPPQATEQEQVQAALDEEIAPGRTLTSWIAANLPADQVVVAATEGQGTGYVLDRPTVSLAPPAFTTQHWGEQEVRSVMLTYHAKFLILYPGDELEDCHSRFLSGLLAGTVPPWLSSAVKGRNFAIFRSEP